MAIPSGGLIHKYDLLDPACYPGSGTVITDTVGSLDLDITGSPTFDSTQGSLTWNGNGIGAYSALGSYANINTNFTISLFVRINDASVSQLIFNNGNRAGSMSGYSSFFDGTGSDLVDFGANNIWGMASASALVQDEWVNLTYTLDSGANQGKIYINGVLSATSSNGVGNAYGVSDFLALGGTGSSTGSPTLQNKASYSVILIYNQTLTGPEVLDIYETYFDRFNPPIVELDFSNPACFNGTGLTVNDLSGSNNDFALADSNYIFTDIYGGELFIDTINLDTLLNCSGLTGYSYGSAAFSFHMWVQINAYNALDLTQIWALNFTGGAGNPHNNPFCGATGASKYFFFTDGTDTLLTSFVMAPDTWYLVTITYPSGGTSNDIEIYIDGVSIAYTGGTAGVLDVASGNPLNSLSASIANSPVWNSAQTIGSYNFYNYELTAADVLDYYNNTQYRFRLYLKYDFSDPACYPGSGPTVFDLSTNGYDANVLFGASFVSDGQASYFQLNGGSDAISTGTNSTAALSDFTMNVWCYPEESSAENILCSIGNDTPGTIPFIDYSLFTASKFLISNGSGVGTVESSISTPINNWYMVTYTKIGTDLKIYIDGVLAGTTTGTVNITNPSEFRLGAYSTGVAPHWEGRIAIAEVYEVGLSSTEVLDLYTTTEARFSAPPAPYTGLVGGRTFGQGFAG